MRIDVVTIFPDYLGPLDVSLVGKAIAAGTLDVRIHDLREFTHDRHRTVDDTPYGGGPGMVMKPEPWGEALDFILDQAPGQPRLVVPTPSGRTFNQTVAQEFADDEWLIFACGRYEVIDEVSVGDYVLAGGEVAALVMIEAAARLLPGVLGNPQSVMDDSFAPGAMEGLLEGPIYTKPPRWRELEVPEILLSGDHGRIAAWRRAQALQRTAQFRPDLQRDQSQ